MRINIIPGLIAFLVSALLTFGFYSYSHEGQKLLLTLGSFLFIFITLLFSIGIGYNESRTGLNIRAVSGIFFFIALASNILFTIIKLSVPAYIITNGIILLIFILIVYSVYRVNE
jgi:hypothetical protein